MRFSTLAAAFSFLSTASFSAAAIATAPPIQRIWLPEPHVACDRVQLACFDSYGLSLGYTQIYFSEAAEAALLDRINAGQEPDTIIQIQGEVKCRLTDQTCLDGNGVSVGLTETYFGTAAAESLRDRVTRRIYMPEANVACDLDQSICFDNMGYSLGYTELYLGRVASTAWTDELQQGKEPAIDFSPSPGVLCDLVGKVCIDTQGVSLGITEEWFGPLAVSAQMRRMYGDPSLQSFCQDAIAVKYQVSPEDIALEFARRDEGGNAYGFTLTDGRQGTCRVLDSGAIEYIQES